MKIKISKINRIKWKDMMPVWWPKGPPQKGSYIVYVFTVKELSKYVLLGIGMLLIVGKAFYDSLFASILLLPFLYFYLDQKSKMLQKKRMIDLEKEFRDTILAVSSNLQAGFSIENSFMEAKKDIEILYGKEADMVYELSLMQQQLHTNDTLEHILFSLATRTESEDIMEFAEVFQIVKRTGGDMRNVITSTANVIKDKISVRLELETTLAEKKLEQNVMKAMPFFIIFYVSLTTKNFFAKLYHNPLGIFIMTVCLAAYVISCVLMKKILEIEI